MEIGDWRTENGEWRMLNAEYFITKLNTNYFLLPFALLPYCPKQSPSRKETSAACLSSH